MEKYSASFILTAILIVSLATIISPTSFLQASATDKTTVSPFDGVSYSEWNKTYGSDNVEIAYSVAEAHDEGYVVTGETEVLSSSNYDVWIVKTDNDGNQQWNKTYGWPGDETGYSVIATIDGGYAIAGSTDSFGAGSQDQYLIKTDSSGNLLWNKTFGGTEMDKTNSLIQTADGGYALAGFVQSAGLTYASVIKTDSSGNLLWNITWRGPGATYARCVIQNDYSDFVVTGDTYTGPINSTDVFLMEVDLNGNIIWNQTYPRDHPDMGSGLAKTADGGYVIGTVNNRALLIKTDSAGNLVWSRMYDSGMGGGSLAMTGDGGFALVGNPESGASSDVSLIKTDSSGGFIGNRTFGNFSSFDLVGSVISASDGSLVIAAGTLSSFDGKNGDFWLIKTWAFTPPVTTNDYDGLWHNLPFPINLTAEGANPINDTYYKINSGPIQSVNFDGQPQITTPSVNNTLEYWSVDMNGNVELPHNVLTGIKLDVTEPICTLVINSGSTYATSSSVNLTLTYFDDLSGVSQMCFSNDGAAWSLLENASTNKTWTLSSGDGGKTVYAQVKDNAGMMSNTPSVSTILDTTPAAGSITINNGDSTTQTTIVTLNLTSSDATSGVSQVCYSNDNGTWSSWEGASASKTWTLTSGDGLKTVYYQIKDNAGLTAVYSDTITLQTPTPTPTPSPEAGSSSSSGSKTSATPTPEPSESPTPEETSTPQVTTTPTETPETTQGTFNFMSLVEISVGVAAISATGASVAVLSKMRKPSESKLRGMPNGEFQGWVLKRLGGRRASPEEEALGIDGFTVDGKPIMINQSSGVGMSMMDKFASAIARKRNSRGVIVAFGFENDALRAKINAKMRYRLDIELLTVAELAYLKSGAA
jgi:hypothetical protein